MNNLPVAATEGGDPSQNGVLSFLPGQRLSRCTCSGESHPGPVHSDGTYVGRAAPEIDIFEAQVCVHYRLCYRLTKMYLSRRFKVVKVRSRNLDSGVYVSIDVKSHVAR